MSLNFLTDIFKSWSGYSTINTVRPALSSIIVLPNGATFGEHPLLRRFLEGVFELKPLLGTSAWYLNIYVTCLDWKILASRIIQGRFQHFYTCSPDKDVKLYINLILNIYIFSRSLFCECKRKTETCTTRATSLPN